MFPDAFSYCVSPTLVAVVSLLFIACQWAMVMPAKEDFFALTQILILAALKLTIAVESEGYIQTPQNPSHQERCHISLSSVSA